MIFASPPGFGRRRDLRPLKGRRSPTFDVPLIQNYHFSFDIRTLPQRIFTGSCSGITEISFVTLSSSSYKTPNVKINCHPTPTLYSVTKQIWDRGENYRYAVVEILVSHYPTIESWAEI